MNPRIARLAAIAVLISAAAPPSAWALTMLPSDFNDICAQAEWVLLAKVVQEDLLPAQDSASAPSMCYTLQPLAQWDRKPALTPPRICYLGDLISPTRTTLAGLRYPALGETGVFFITTPNSGAVVSPLAGWNQGHFQVQTRAGAEAVFTAGGTAVCGFDAGRRSSSMDGVAADGLVLDRPGSHCAPIPLTVFEQKVRQCVR